MSAPRRRGGRIEIRALRVVGTHGALAEERERAQPFELDLDLWVDTAPAAASDRLADTVDYGVVAERAASVVASTSFLVLEALADAVAAAVAGLDPRIERVAVTVRKLHPPVPLDLGSVAVRAVRPGPEEDRDGR